MSDDSVLKDFLIDTGLVSRAQADDALRRAEEAGAPLSSVLIESGVLSEDAVRRAASHAHGVPYVELGHDNIILDALILIPEPIARLHNAVAYRAGERDIEVAVLDLRDLAALEPLQSGWSFRRVLPRLTSRDSMRRALVVYQRHLRDTFGRYFERERSPALLVQQLLRHALLQQANAVHLDASSAGLQVRYRHAGILRDAMQLPAHVGALCAELRAAAGISPRAPGEGHVRVDLGHGESVSVRVAAAPTIDGDKLVLHLITEGARRGFTLESFGLHGEALEALYAALLQKQGLIAVCGGAHSGKTTLLYTMLDLLNAPERAIATIEERIEHRIARAAQVELCDISAAGALRAVLRQDPDVVMVSEVRDEQVAALVRSAARRGMLVLAGAEAGQALGADMVVSVALVRRLCTKQFADTRKLTRPEQDVIDATGADCARVLAALKEEGVIDKAVAWKDVPFARASACSSCKAGYEGFVGLAEVVGQGELRGLSLIEDGLFKAARGDTSLEEVLGAISA